MGSADSLTRLEVLGNVATLTLDDPSRLNPLTETLLAGCLDALNRVRNDQSIRVLVVRANGKGFCAGANLDSIDPATARLQHGETVGDQVFALLRDFGHLWVEGVRGLDVPVVAAVHGVAAGGGVGFALAADFVVAARSAYFMLPFVPALGLVPDLGAAWVMQKQLGEQRTFVLAMLGEKLHAEEAARCGLIYRCVDDAQLSTEVDALASRLAQLPPSGVRELRELMRHAREKPLPAFLTYERERQRDLINSASFAEGVAAFRQRRTPNFPPRG